MKKNKIFVACDTSKISKINEIIKKTQHSKIKVGYKFGLEFLETQKQVKKFTLLKKKQFTLKCLKTCLIN